MSYVDSFMVPVPKANLEAYKELARHAGPVWKEHGAIAYVETVADDVPLGEVTSFPRAVQARDDETVVLSWVLWESREARERGLPKVRADPRMQGDDWNQVFDGKRLIFGGFEAFLEL